MSRCRRFKRDGVMSMATPPWQTEISGACNE
jgi:hypothetical protein